MLAAFLAATLFALSVVFASRTTRALGVARANFYRLCVAAMVLGIWAHGWGGGLAGGAFSWFFLSGCIGFGVGDLALYQSLWRVGPRLAGLLVQCLAAPFAAVAEWGWMGTAPTVPQLWAGLAILVGVGVAVAPEEHLKVGRRVLFWGVLFGVVAALGQGLGAVVSRRAYGAVELAGGHVDGLTAAYQRILGGLMFALPSSVWLLLRERRRASQPPVRVAGPPGHPGEGKVWFWVVLNALAGPALGVGCYQWALASTPSGVVLPIVATMPILVIPLAWVMEGDRPSVRSVLGGVVAVGGVVAMALMRSGG
jgi:drug/metabolite transporter (DMT)-like permease